MKRMLALSVLAAVLVVSMFGCYAAVTQPVTGFLYTSTKGATAVGTGSAAGELKKGESCVTSILGWIATGDASIEAAKTAGGISNIAYVDYTGFSVLGIFAKYCTVVYGK